MDDTPDKVRRNLLVYCGALLIGLYLDVDFKSILNIPGINVPKLDPFKTTVLSLMILCYLMARFSYSKEYKEGGSYSAHFKTLPYDLVLDYVRKASADYLVKGRTSKRAAIFDWAGLDASIEGFRQQNARFSTIKVDVEFGEPSAPAKDHVGLIEVACSGLFDGNKTNFIAPGIPTNAKYKIPKLAVAWMKAKTFWRLLANDEHFISAKLPMLLGLITFFYLVVKLTLIAVGL